MALQRQKKTKNVWSCERLDHSESKAEGYVTMSSIVLGPTEGILDGYRELVVCGGVILDELGRLGKFDEFHESRSQS